MSGYKPDPINSPVHLVSAPVTTDGDKRSSTWMVFKLVFIILIMRNRSKDRKGFCEQRVKQEEAERETTANDKKAEYKKKEKKRGLHVGGGVTFLWAKHSHETKGTCPGVLRVGENRVRRKMKLVG